MNSPEDLARQRFMILNLVRFGAIGAHFRRDADRGALGYVLLIVGVLDFFLAPVLLKRNWRNPDA